MGATGKALALLAVVVLVVVGLWLWLRPAEVSDRVMIVGDSVTVLSVDDLKGDLGAKHPAYIARNGYRSTDLLPMVRDEVKKREVASEDLKQIALLVGYNDVLRHDVETPSLDKLMDLADRFDCAVWLTLPPVGLQGKETDRWNERVKAAAEKRSGIHLVTEWREAVMDDPKLVMNDTVHPSVAGRRELTRIYHDGIRNLC